MDLNDLYEDIRRHVLATLPHRTEDHAELEAIHVSDLLILYFNWRSRRVSSRPRTVHISSALPLNPLASDPKYKPGLDQIIAMIQAGDDLTPHLSRGIQYGYQGSGPPRETHLDPMLNDWGIHHLHLLIEMEPDGFVKRDGPVLFAAFRPNDAYLIDIMHHGDWVRERVMHLIIEEWPETGLMTQMTQLPSMSLSALPTEDERKKMRKAGVAAGFDIGTGIFFPDSLFTTAGTSMTQTEAADNLLNRVRRFAELTQRPDDLAKTLADYGIVLPPNPDLHFVFFDDESYGIAETATGITFRLA